MRKKIVAALATSLTFGALCAAPFAAPVAAAASESVLKLKSTANLCDTGRKAA